VPQAEHHAAYGGGRGLGQHPAQRGTAMVLWQDIAEALRAGIARGDYPPGSTIPKETELMAAHGTGRDPVRRAVAQLTAQGLVEPVRRRGTVVRQHPSRRRITRSRLVYRDELGYYFDQTAQGWRPVQPPSVSRGPVPHDIAAQLGLELGAEVIIRDRVMGDPATGRPPSSPRPTSRPLSPASC